MAIPKVEIGQINNAFRLFDTEYRNSIDWIGWETRKTQKYVIRSEGKIYPPKMIISLATGLPRSEFNGGSQSIRYLAKYNVRVEPIARRFQDHHPAAGNAY